MNVNLRRRYGMGGLGDAAYDALVAGYVQRVGVPAAVFAQTIKNQGWNPADHSYPDPATCIKIQCGAISQSEAGPNLLVDCATAGFAGVRSCADPMCAPYCGRAAAVAMSAQPLPVAPRVAAMFLSPPARSCDPVYGGPKFNGPYGDDGADTVDCCGFSRMVCEHPFLAVGLVLGGAWLVRKAVETRR